MRDPTAPGTLVISERRPQAALLRKRHGEEHPVDRAYGTIRIKASVDTLIDEMRGARPQAVRKARRR